MSDQDRGSNFLTGLIFGALVGVGAAWFLTSTEEGKKIKKQLLKKGETAFDGLKDLIDEVEEKGEEFKKAAKNIQTELEEKTKDIRQEIAGEAKEQLGQIEQLRERGRQATKRFFTKNGKSLAQ